jgi:hypothetical protein
MEDYYKATVTKISSKTLYIKLTIINSDIVVFPLRNDSALMIICQSLEEVPASENYPRSLKNNIALLGSHETAKKEKAKYIREFTLLTKYKWPAPKSAYKLKGDDFRKWWDNEDNLPYGEYKIVVKDENLISHFKVGDSWKTSVAEYGD